MNPNKQFGIFDYLVSITRLCDKHLLNDIRYLNIKFSNDRMVKQGTSGYMSFRYDKVCLAIEPSTAIRYCTNKYGSELLTRVIYLTDLLTESGIEKEIDRSKLKIDLNFVKGQSHRKIMLMIEDIMVNEIETEDGRNAKEKLEEFGRIKSEDPSLYDTLSQQLNFCLLKPIAIDRIKIAEVDDFKVDIDIANSKGSVEYSLKPYKK